MSQGRLLPFLPSVTRLPLGLIPPLARNEQRPSSTMKVPTVLASVCLAFGTASAVDTGLLGSGLAPLLTGVDNQLYQIQKQIIGEELSAWLAKWKDVSLGHGWVPVPEFPNASAEEVEEQLKQRFFLAKQLVDKLQEENPHATFSTDSPFTLLTPAEFAAYVKNSHIKGGGRRNLRKDAALGLGDLINGNSGETRPSNDAPPPSVGKPTSRPKSNQDVPVSPSKPSSSSQSDSLDWSKGKCMPPIQNQGQCGSCWAFSSVAAVEIGQCIARGGTGYAKFSEQTLASCDNRGSGCDGGVPQYALEYVQSNGLCSLSDDPYTSGDGNLAACNKGCTRYDSGVTGVQTLPRSEDALLSALAHQPVILAVQAGNEAWKQYKSGVLMACPDSAADVDHGVVAVGYDSESIKIRNSWGHYWGEEGYVRLARSTSGLGTCKMLESMVHPKF